MKTITITEFETLIARNDWQHEQDLEVMAYEERESGGLIDKKFYMHAMGWATKTSRLDEIEIIYNEGFEFDVGDPDSFESSTYGQDKIWTITGISVIDENDIEISGDELGDYLNSYFSDIDYSEFKAATQKD